jgi:hypothetical protein
MGHAKQGASGFNNRVTDPIPRPDFNPVVITVICHDAHRHPIIVAGFDLLSPSQKQDKNKTCKK